MDTMTIPTITVNGVTETCVELTMNHLLPGNYLWGRLIESVTITGYPQAGIPLKYLVKYADAHRDNHGGLFMSPGGWIPLSALVPPVRECRHELSDGNADDPSYAYCGLPLAHAGEHGRWIK